MPTGTPDTSGEAVVGNALVVLALMGAAVTPFAFQHAAVGLPIMTSTKPAAVRAIPATVLATPPGGIYPLPEDVAIRPLLPSHVFLNVPFTAQAPFGDWSDPYGEACEEASAVMAMAWARGEAISPERANTEILNQVLYENFYFGYNEDTALRETAKLITRFYGYAGVRVTYGITADDIRRELAAGNIVLLPVAGELLANPYYIGPPPYHMLVVHGYDDTTREFIVNDPGTRRGQNYRYPYATLVEAVHDWTGRDATLRTGRTGMIVVRPPSV